MSKRKYIIEIGQRYGTLTVLEKALKAGYRCRCDCGNFTIRSAVSLSRGKPTCKECRKRWGWTSMGAPKRGR